MTAVGNSCLQSLTDKAQETMNLLSITLLISIGLPYRVSTTSTQHSCNKLVVKESGSDSLFWYSFDYSIIHFVMASTAQQDLAGNSYFSIIKFLQILLKQ